MSHMHAHEKGGKTNDGKPQLIERKLCKLAYLFLFPCDNQQDPFMDKGPNAYEKCVCK